MYFNTLIIMNEDALGYGNRSRKPSGYCKLAMPNRVTCYVQGLRQLPKGQVYRLYLTSKSRQKSVEVGMFQVATNGNKETRWVMDPSSINNSGVNAQEIDGALIIVDGENLDRSIVPLVGFSSEPYTWGHLVKNHQQIETIPKESALSQEINHPEETQLTPDVQTAKTTPIVEDTQVADAIPVVEDIQVADARSVVEDTQVADTTPVVEDIQVADIIPAAEDTQVADARLVVEEAQIADTTPAAEATEIVGATPIEETIQQVRAEDVAQVEIGKVDTALLQENQAESEKKSKHKDVVSNNSRESILDKVMADQILLLKKEIEESQRIIQQLQRELGMRNEKVNHEKPNDQPKQKASEKAIGIDEYVNNFIRTFQTPKKTESKPVYSEVDAIFTQRIPINPFEAQNTGIKWVRITHEDLKSFASLNDEWINQPAVMNAYRDYKHFILGKDQLGLAYYVGIPGVYNHQEGNLLDIDKIERFRCCRNMPPTVGESGYWIARI